MLQDRSLKKFSSFLTPFRNCPKLIWSVVYELCTGEQEWLHFFCMSCERPHKSDNNGWQGVSPHVPKLLLHSYLPQEVGRHLGWHAWVRNVMKLPQVLDRGRFRWQLTEPRPGRTGRHGRMLLGRNLSWPLTAHSPLHTECDLPGSGGEV